MILKDLHKLTCRRVKSHRCTRKTENPAVTSTSFTSKQQRNQPLINSTSVSTTALLPMHRMVCGKIALHRLQVLPIHDTKIKVQFVILWSRCTVCGLLHELISGLITNKGPAPIRSVQHDGSKRAINDKKVRLASLHWVVERQAASLGTLRIVKEHL